jgi:aspartate/methionine/tyrosine aminotransferase
MKITPFAIERYFAKHEFTARHLLSCSDCEPLTLSEVLELADEEVRACWDTLRLAYTESQGLPLLRREIAGLYRGVDPDEVLEVIPEEGILLAMQALLEPGDHVVATFPGYQSLHQIARDMRCEVTPWQPQEEHGWRFGLDALRAALRPTTRLVVINFPHNPTGAMLSRDELGRLVELVEATGAVLLSDEMYRWLEREPAATLPSAVELSDRALSLCGLSKSLSAPGLRVGWLVTHDSALRERLAVGKDYTTICGSAPAEILAVAILRARQGILTRNRALIAANARLFDDFASRYRGFLSWTPPAAGPVAFARLGEATGAGKLCQRLTAEAGVMMLPSTVFEHGDRHVRIGLGRASFKAGLDAVDEWLAHA